MCCDVCQQHTHVYTHTRTCKVQPHLLRSNRHAGEMVQLEKPEDPSSVPGAQANSRVCGACLQTQPGRGRSLLASQSSLIGESRSVRDPVSKEQDRQYSRNTQSCPLACTRTHTCTQRKYHHKYPGESALKASLFQYQPAPPPYLMSPTGQRSC